MPLTIDTTGPNGILIGNPVRRGNPLAVRNLLFQKLKARSAPDFRLLETSICWSITNK